MKFEEFIKEVMHRGSMESRAQAQEATRATLETLSEHLTGDEADNVASQLPPQLAVYLQQPFAGVAERFSLDEFFMRVSEREGVGLLDATQHARAAASVFSEAIDLGQLEHMIAQLPTDVAQLFMVQNAGATPPIEDNIVVSTSPNDYEVGDDDALIAMETGGNAAGGMSNSTSDSMSNMPTPTEPGGTEPRGVLTDADFDGDQTNI